MNKKREFGLGAKKRADAVVGACTGGVVALAVMAGTAMAHHSFAMFDQKKMITLEGTVVAFQWTNPHVFIELDVPGARSSTHWSIELNSPNNLRRNGWTRTSMAAGDKVAVRVAPLRNGKPGGLFLDAKLADGKVLDSGLPKDGTPVNVPNL